MVKITNLVKSFGMQPHRVHLFTRLDFSAQSGQTIALYGRSGAGKSTLLQMLAGLEVADGGSIIVDGFDISSANPRETARFRLNKVGFVFQFFNLLPTLTLLQNVALPSLLAGKGRSKSHTRARELLARVALKSEAGRLPEEVSGGQCQRAAIARALINEPELILADEPTGNLDLNTARSILELFSWVREVSSPTIIIATHDREVASIADRTLTLREGKLG